MDVDVSTVPRSLDGLEQDVLRQIALHRQRAGRTAVPVGAIVTACALLAGLGVGVVSARRSHGSLASEAVVLGDDASLAPSTLLGNGS